MPVSPCGIGGWGPPTREEKRAGNAGVGVKFLLGLLLYLIFLVLLYFGVCYVWLLRNFDLGVYYACECVIFFIFWWWFVMGKQEMYKWVYLTDDRWLRLCESGAVGDFVSTSDAIRYSVKRRRDDGFRDRFFLEVLIWCADNKLSVDDCRSRVEDAGESFGSFKQKYYWNKDRYRRLSGAMLVLGFDPGLCGRFERMIVGMQGRSEKYKRTQARNLRKKLKRGDAGAWEHRNNWGKLTRRDGDAFYARREELCLETLDWCEKHLVIGDGVGWVGQRFKWMGWYRDFIIESYRPGVHECGLSVARKNGKTAGLAAWLLGCMLGPIRYLGFSCLVASEKESKASVFAEYVIAMCVESGLCARERGDRGKFHDGLGIDGFQVIDIKGASGERVIQSWDVESKRLWGELRVKAYSPTVGDAHRASFVVIDEGGRLGVEGSTPYEGQRMAWNTLRSSLGSGGDHFMVVSAEYNGMMFRQMRERYERGDSGSLYFKRYSTPLHYALDDREGWRMSNPSLDCGVKGLAEMEEGCKNAMMNDMDERDFREQELNQPQGNSLNQMVSEAVWSSRVYVDEGEMLSDRKVEQVSDLRCGGCFIGFDLGANRSMSVMVVLWFGSGFVECYGGFPGLRVSKVTGKNEGYNLLDRGVVDGVGDVYSRMEKVGELRMYESDIEIPLSDFFREVWEGRLGFGEGGLRADFLGDHRILKVSMDQYKLKGYQQAMNLWQPRGYEQWSNKAIREKPEHKQNDIRDCISMVNSGKIFTCAGYGGMLLTHSLRNTTIEHRSSYWRIKPSVEGNNDAAVALTNVCGCYIFEENREKSWGIQSGKDPWRLVNVSGGY